LNILPILWRSLLHPITNPRILFTGNTSQPRQSSNVSLTAWDARVSALNRLIACLTTDGKFKLGVCARSWRSCRAVWCHLEGIKVYFEFHTHATLHFKASQDGVFSRSPETFSLSRKNGVFRARRTIRDITIGLLGGEPRTMQIGTCSDGIPEGFAALLRIAQRIKSWATERLPSPGIIMNRVITNEAAPPKSFVTLETLAGVVSLQHSDGPDYGHSYEAPIILIECDMKSSNNQEISFDSICFLWVTMQLLGTTYKSPHEDEL
jgi:hypothetical protein